MADGTDFAQQTLAVNVIDDTFITEGTRLICYNQPIYDDMHVELDEYAGLTLGVIDNDNVLTTILTRMEPMYDQVSILIVDNDSELMTQYACGFVIRYLACNGILLFQWLWWVWSRHSTLLQRMEGVLKCVLLCTYQTLIVPYSSLSLSYSLLETSLQVLPRYVPALILFTSLQSLPWITVQLLTQ